MKGPKNIAELLARSDKIWELIEFAEAWRNGEIILASGQRIPIQWSPGSANAVFDLRSLTASGQQVNPPLPSQSGHAGALFTNGTVPFWLDSLYTHVAIDTNQTITGSTFQAVAFDVAVEQPEAPNVIWDAGTPTRLTIPSGMGGVWAFSAEIYYEPSAAAGQRYIRLRKNGAIYITTFQLPVTTGDGVFVPLPAGFERLAAGEYLELIAFAGVVGGGSSNTDISQAKLKVQRTSA